MKSHCSRTQFYAMVSFTNPGVLGTTSQFRRHFEAPILAGREPDADDATQVRTSAYEALSALQACLNILVCSTASRK